MSTRPNCPICDNQLSFVWCDYHGIGACIHCGAPHRIYHYDENNKPIQKGPESLTLERWVPWMRRFYAETGHRAPNSFDIPGNYPTYSGVTVADVRAWNEWTTKHKEQLDALAQPAPPTGGARKDT